MTQISNTGGPPANGSSSGDPMKSMEGRFGGEPKEVVGQAKEAASQAASKAKDIVSKRVATTAERGAGDIGDIAKALHKTSKDLEDNIASPYVEKAADQLDRLSGFLRNASVPEIARKGETFARDEPALFLGGAFVLGVAAARFLKSSAHHVDDLSSDYDRDTYPGMKKPEGDR